MRARLHAECPARQVSISEIPYIRMGIITVKNCRGTISLPAVMNGILPSQVRGKSASVTLLAGLGEQVVAQTADHRSKRKKFTRMSLASVRARQHMLRVSPRGRDAIGENQQSC